MDYFFFIFFFLSVFNIKIKGSDGFFLDYMELENTNSIRGIFVWLIIFCHKTKYGVDKNYYFKTIIHYLGQQVVAVFFFYSGFGIFESLKKKGNLYSKTLPQKACILFIKFQLILLIFLVANILVLNNKIRLKKYLESIIFRNSLGNSNWFAFTIIIFYIYSYFSFRFITYRLPFGLIIISFLCFLHSIFVFYYYYPKTIYAVDTILSFVSGFYFSFIKEHFDKIILKSDIHYFGFTSVVIFIYYKFSQTNDLINISIKNSLFVILIIIISIKIKFNNDLLKFLNTHSFSIYLFQRLVFMIVYKKDIFKNNDFLKISFEFTSIFFLACIFDKYTIFIDKYFKRDLNKNKINKYIPINIINYNGIMNIK